MARPRTQSNGSVAQHLDAVVARFPVLSALRATLGPDGLITPGFLEAYVRSDVPGVLRERLLMAALGDCSERNEEPVRTPEIERRTLFFLEHHPTQPLSPWQNRFKREHIPQRLRRLYAPDAEPSRASTDLRPRLDAFEFLRRALVQPAVDSLLAHRVAAATNRRTAVSASDAHQHRLLAGFVLTPEESRRLLIEPRARHAFTHYFHTGHPLLDVRNALQFYLALLKRTDFEASATGKTSRRIDRTLLGLPRRGSHPLIALTTQLSAFGILGLIEPDRGPWQDPHLGPVLRLLRQASHTFDIEDIARRHVGHWILDATSVERWHAALSGDGPSGRYSPALLFDPQFVLDTMARGDGGATLAGHYAHISTPALREYLLDHYLQRDPEFAERLAAWCHQAPDLFVGVRLRALANALYYAHFLEERGEEPRVALPLSAKVALGAVRDPRTPAPRPRDSVLRQRALRQSPDRVTDLPLLDRLVRAPARPRKPPFPRRPRSPAASLTEIGEVLGRIRTSRETNPTPRRGR